jgi:tetratricopeptide (TPR) repeat protein
MLIKSDDTEYYSNRIIKSITGLRYIYRIHEVITDKNNVNVTVPNTKAIIFDNRADYMEKRTMDRKKFDLELLFKEFEEDPDDPRALYYIAQTYGCMGDELNKAKYFELRIKHPVQGYFQEKIDACFELARTYNFKINCETLEPLTHLTESQWKHCEELYLQAYSLDKKRPDSLYFIGIHYYLSGNYQLAYKYLKRGFEVGYPVNSQYSLKPTLSFHFLPKFLTELCYYVDDFSTGKKASELFLTTPQFNTPGSENWNLMENWYSIYSQLLKLPELSKNPIKSNRPIFCIVTDGGWEPWTGKDILTKGLGGSETWVIETARALSAYFNVVVFCNCNESSYFESVGYNPVNLFHEFVSTYSVEYCIVSRFTEYIPVAIKGHVNNIGVIFHDLLRPELIIPKDPKIKWLFGLSEWHSKLIKNIFPYFNVFTSMYGIRENENSDKVKNSFIFSSFPNRGLLPLLKMWPKIIKRFPDATLNVYCYLDHPWTNKVAGDQIKSIKMLLKINTKGVTNHGWVSKSELSVAWSKAEYWLYPCTFEETFCLTAMEAAISKTFTITNGLAALEETGSGCLVVPGDPSTDEWQSKTLEVLFEVMESNKIKNLLIEKNYQFAKNMTWESQTKKLIEIIYG